MGVRQAAVALVVVLLSAITAFGLLGPAVGPERIHSFDVVATIREDRTVDVREVIDWDFGLNSKRGIFRLIPSDGGAPTGIEVSSPTAPDEFVVTPKGTDTEIRIGDPDTKIRGRHRYEISYKLPSTIVEDRFALDAIGTRWPVGVAHADVLVLGAELSSPGCFIGPAGSTDRCEISSVDEGLRVELDDLDAYEGITIDGDVASTRPAELPAIPPFEDRDSSARWVWAGVVAALGTLVALAVFVICRQIGRNEVAGGGATEAAFVPYGSETFGPQHTTPSEAPPPVPGARKVADSKMGELAGLEFVPPGGVESWQGAVVLRETIDDRTVGSWFSSQAARDVVTITREGETVTLAPGPKAASADATTAPILNRALGGSGAITLGTYSPSFSTAWKEAGAAIDGWVASSQVFRRRPPHFGSAAGVRNLIPCLALPFLLVVGGGASVISGFNSGLAAIAIAIGVPALVAALAYAKLTRSLSAKGSAIALRSESFRRFLHDSEAQHVEWAWQNGLLRDYSAWAVALGEADAWNAAMAVSSVPPVEQSMSSGILMPAIYFSSFSSTTSPPSSSGSGGGGGFSGGGFSGGGGGGGGGGSW